MRHSLFTSSLLLTLSTVGCTLPGVGDDGDTGNDEDSDETAHGSTSNVDDGATGGTDDSSGSGVDDSTSDDADSSTGDAPATNCTQATLLMGNPYFDGELSGWNPTGQALLADPPLRSRHLADTGGHVAIETQTEVWVADGDQVHRVAGNEADNELQYQPSGACADTRFIITDGVAGLPNGNLVVADVRGNGLVELSDPLGDCTAAPIAGNPDAVLDVDISDDVAAIGDIEGPGVDARFFGVQRPYADADGNVYVDDAGNTKIKRIANDADRTVTTVFDYPGDQIVLAMTVLDGVLYATGASAVQDIVWSIDLEAGGEATELFAGTGLFPEVDSSQMTTMFALTHDGQDLLVASNKGYIFRMSTAAQPIGVVAGMGQIVDYPADLDLSMPIPVEQLPIRSYAVNEASLLHLGDDILFTNNANGTGYHVWSIHCE